MFYFDEIAGKKVLKSTMLPMVEHFFTTREIPIAAGALDIADECLKNREIIANHLEISTKALISPTQTHSSNITIAQKMKSDYPETDALVLSSKNLAIALNFADCVPVMLYDKKNNIGAIAHAGWRGTAAKIVPETLKFMANFYETEPQDVIALIGPAISGENYQVDKEVFEKIIKTINSSQDECYRYDENSQKFNIDLKKVNYYQLKENNVNEIDLCGYCTFDSSDIFFSYRKENGKTARHSAVMKLKEIN